MLALPERRPPVAAIQSTRPSDQPELRDLPEMALPHGRIWDLAVQESGWALDVFVRLFVSRERSKEWTGTTCAPGLVFVSAA